MILRSSLVAPCLVTLLVACGGTVVFEEGSGSGSGGGGDGGAPSVVTTGPGSTSQSIGSSVSTTQTASTSTNVATVVSSVEVSSSSGAGGFGTQDLYPQYLGEPSDDRNVFSIADNALGAQIFARSPSRFGECEIGRLTAPSGSIVFDGLIPSNMQGFANNGVSSMVIPQIDHPECFPDVAPGTWSVRISPFGNVHDVTVLERQTVDGEFHGGVLDVNVFLVAGVADPDYIRSQLDNAYSNWAGLTLGDVRFYDLGEQFYELDEFNYFDAVDVTSSAPAGQAITIMAVGSLGGAFADAGGFTIAAPADPIGHGSPPSTLTWRVYNDGFFDAIVVGHESGHYSGLSHTSEFYDPNMGEPRGFDPLSDTPECADIEDGNNTFDFSFCDDFDYLMFPTGGSGAVQMSSMQAQVIQGSSVYRGIYQDGEAPAAPFQDLVGGQRAPRSPRPAPRSLELDGRGAAPTAPIAGPTPASLRATLPREVAALDGIGCAEGIPMSDRLDAAARASSAGALLALARDPRATPMFRGRALSAASRAAGADAIVDDIQTIALDAALPEPLRESAVRALGRIAPVKRAAIAPALRSDASRLMRHLAK